MDKLAHVGNFTALIERVNIGKLFANGDARFEAIGIRIDKHVGSQFFCSEVPQLCFEQVEPSSYDKQYESGSKHFSYHVNRSLYQSAVCTPHRSQSQDGVDANVGRICLLQLHSLVA